MLFNTVALGLLRRELVETLGQMTARHPHALRLCARWRTAEVLRQQFEWDSEHEAWQLAGGRVHQLQGFLIYEPVPVKLVRAPKRWRNRSGETLRGAGHLIHLGPRPSPCAGRSPDLRAAI